MSLLADFSWEAIDPQTRATIGTAIVSVIGFFVRWLITPRSRVAWGVPHQFAFTLPNAGGPGTLVRTREVWVQNIGSATANNITICLNHGTQHIEVWPPGEHEKTATDDGRILIKIPRIVRRDFLRVMLFDARNIELPDVLYIKWDDGEAKQRSMGPSQLLPRWAIECLRVLVVIGAIATVYFCLRGIQLLAI
jgi:hypothetical protein